MHLQLGFDLATNFLMVVHVVSSSVWIGGLWAILLTMGPLWGTLSKEARHSISVSLLPIALKVIMASGVITLFAGPLLAEVMGDSITQFLNPTLRNLGFHVGGALGLIVYVLVIIFALPASRDLIKLTGRADKQRKANSCRTRLRNVATLGVAMMMVAVALMVLARAWLLLFY